MADLSDVENGLVSLLAGALFPTIAYLEGDSQTAATGIVTKLYRGWPNDTQAYQDALAGSANISIFQEPGMTRNTTRFMLQTRQVATVAPTLTASVSGATVSIGGSVTPGNVVGIVTGGSASLLAYAHAALQGDTLTSIAATLAEMIPGATATGPVITLSTSDGLYASTMAPQPAMTEVSRQEQGFRISCWCPSPAARDSTAKAVHLAVAGLRDAQGRFTEFMALPSGDTARIRHRSVYVNDMPERDALWRRDECYFVEYPTTISELDPLALFIGGPLNANTWGVANRLFPSLRFNAPRNSGERLMGWN